MYLLNKLILTWQKVLDVTDVHTSEFVGAVFYLSTIHAVPRLHNFLKLSFSFHVNSRFRTFVKLYFLFSSDFFFETS